MPPLVCVQIQIFKASRKCSRSMMVRVANSSRHVFHNSRGKIEDSSVHSKYASSHDQVFVLGTCEDFSVSY